MSIEDADLIDGISRRFAELDPSIVFVHSNVMQGIAVERPAPFDRQQFLANHYSVIRQMTGEARLWFPAFNYKFPGTRVFDQQGDRSEVGHLSEYIRTDVTTWRTPVPVFSVVGTGDQPELPATPAIDAFGTGSIFHPLVEQDGFVFNYGCDLGSLTLIHYTESIAKSPYRYEKNFTGRMIDLAGEESDTTVRFHVRPQDREMTYDWPMLQADLKQQGMLEAFGGDGREFQIISAGALHEYWLDKLTDNPLFFLTDKTRNWVEPMLAKLGRPFTLADFES